MEEKVVTEIKITKKEWICGITICICLLAAGGFLFSAYGYAVIKSIRYMGLMTGLVYLAFIDKKYHIIPNRILLMMAVCRAVILVIEIICSPDLFTEFLASALGGLTLGLFIFLLVYLLSRKGIGMGDVKLVALIGFCIGSSGLFGAMFLAAIFSVVYSIMQMLRKKLTMKDSFAFGPFLAMGTIAALLLGV